MKLFLHTAIALCFLFISEKSYSILPPSTYEEALNNSNNIVYAEVLDVAHADTHQLQTLIRIRVLKVITSSTLSKGDKIELNIASRSEAESLPTGGTFYVQKESLDIAKEHNLKYYFFLNNRGDIYYPAYGGLGMQKNLDRLEKNFIYEEYDSHTNTNTNTNTNAKYGYSYLFAYLKYKNFIYFIILFILIIFWIGVGVYYLKKYQSIKVS